MAITYQQAVQFMNSPIGSQLPYLKQVLGNANDFNSLSGSQKAMYLGKIEQAMKDPVSLAVERLKNDVAGYVIYQNLPGGGGTAQAAAQDLKARIDSYVSFLQNNGQSVDEITSVINKGYLTGAESLKEQVGRMNETSVIDKVADVALNVGLGVATGGLGFTEQIIANALLQAGQGIKPQDIVRNITATIAANSLTQGIPGVESSKIIPKTLNELNQKIANLAPNIVNPTVASALINAERQAVAAAITKQDIVENAIAGAAGGTVADLASLGIETASPTMNKQLVQALSKSAAEYAQYKAAGFTDEQALQKSLSSYITQSQKIEADAAKAESDAAKSKKDTTAGLGAEKVGVAQTYGNQYTGTEKALPEQTSSETATQPTLNVVPGQRPLSATDTRTNIKNLPTQYATAKEFLPGGTTTATAGDDLSLLSTTTETKPKEKTPEQQRRDIILTSLINKNVTSPLYSNKVVQQAGTPGTAALSQALRVGDIGAPIFGREEEGRKAGWNLESLRYMGDVGE